MSLNLTTILKKDYVELFELMVSSGYLSGDLSSMLLDIRYRLSESSAKRMFLLKPKVKSVKVDVVSSSDDETVLPELNVKKAKKEKKVKESNEVKPKKEKKANEKNEKKEKKEKRTVIPSAYMCFLSDKRSEIKMLLKEETPDISAKDLNLSVMKKAGEIWKALSDEEKKPYVEKSSLLKSGSLSVDVVQEQVQVQEQEQEVQVQEQEQVQEQVQVQEHEKIQEQEKIQEVQEQVETKVDVVEDVLVPTSDAEVDEDVLVYNASFNVWVHEVSGMYYVEDDIDGEPLGQLKNGKLVPFKKPASTKKRVSQ